MRLKPRKIQSYSDLELLANYKSSNNTDYIGILYKRYTGLLYGVCLKYLKTPVDAQDAVMQIYENLQSSIKSYEINNFKSWLYVVAKNYCLNQLRKQKHTNEQTVEYQNIFENFMDYESDLHPLDKETDEDSEKALRFCIEKLRDVHKKSVELFYFKELTYQQISLEMDIEIKKVKSYLQNAKRNLKICLEQNNVSQ